MGKKTTEGGPKKTGPKGQPVEKKKVKVKKVKVVAPAKAKRDPNKRYQVFVKGKGHNFGASIVDLSWDIEAAQEQGVEVEVQDNLRHGRLKGPSVIQALHSARAALALKRKLAEEKAAAAEEEKKKAAQQEALNILMVKLAEAKAKALETGTAQLADQKKPADAKAKRPAPPKKPNEQLLRSKLVVKKVIKPSTL